MNFRSKQDLVNKANGLISQIDSLCEQIFDFEDLKNTQKEIFGEYTEALNDLNRMK